jgi:hypothetical protein
MCKQQLYTLALLHGTFWQSKEPAIKELVHFASQHAGLILANDNAHWSMLGFREAKSVVPERLYKQHDHIWPATLICLTRNAASPETWVHSDCHFGNWFQLPDGRVCQFSQSYVPALTIRGRRWVCRIFNASPVATGRETWRTACRRSGTSTFGASTSKISSSTSTSAVLIHMEAHPLAA